MEKLQQLSERPGYVVPELRDYQIDDLAFMIREDRCLLLHDPGCGKTPPVCIYTEYLWEYEEVKTAFVMPKSLLRKNYDELLRFTKFAPDDIVVIDGTPKQRSQQIETPTGKVFLMGFLRYADDWRNLRRIHPQLNACIVDEFHAGFSGDSSQRTQAFYQSMRTLKYFVGMTGTLIRGRLDSAFPAIKVIEPRYYGSHKQFLARHAIYDLDGGIIGWQNHALLGQILKIHARRMAFKDVYGEEARIIQVETVDMTPDVRKKYDDFHALAMLELSDEYLDGFNPAVQVIRCRQIMAHPHKIPLQGGGYESITTKKLTGKDERLLVHIEGHNRPQLVFSVLIPEQERCLELAKKAGRKAALLNGSVPAAKRAQIDEQFRSGALDLVVASPDVAGIGFNWGHVDHAIFVSLNYMDDSFVQAYRRAVRGVRESPLLITILKYRDSIDGRILQIIKTKNDHARQVDPTAVEISMKQGEAAA